MIRRLITLVALIGTLSHNLASAQDLSTYYTVMHPDQFSIDWKSIYMEAERMTDETRAQLPHELDISYGPHAKQKLDIYFPSADFNEAAVLVFLHGGGNREGDRRQYGYVAAPFAKHGIVTVVASYRLQPEFRWPAQRDDARSVLAWVYQNIKSRGGSPDRIYLAGHSAGSRLTAVLSYRDDWRDAMSLPDDLIKGAALISGVSSQPSAEEIPNREPRLEANVMQEIASAPPRNVIAVGSLETEGGSNGRRLKNSEEVAERILAEGGEVNFIVPVGMDHATLVLSLGDERSELFKSILYMITS